MGGGDLNMKKSWHPLLMKNQERVWKEERKAVDERKKTAQLQKELAEERQLQELQRLQAAQGGGRREERVDWLYATPSAGTGVNLEDQEAYLLGRKTVDKLFKEKDEAAAKMAAKATQADKDKPGGGFISLQNANTARDTASKIREDPMLAIKQQEQLAYEAFMKNPARLRAMQEGGTPKEGKRGLKKLEKEERRRAKMERRERRDEERRGGDGKRSRHHEREVEEGADRDRRYSPDRRYREDERHRSPSPPHERSRSSYDQQHSHRRRRSSSPPPTRQRDRTSRHESRSPPRRRRHFDDITSRHFSPGRSGDDDTRPTSHPHSSRRSSSPGTSSRLAMPPPPPPPPPPHYHHHHRTQAHLDREAQPIPKSTKLSESKAAKLAEMQAAAKALHASRSSRLHQLESEDLKTLEIEEIERERNRIKSGGVGDGNRAKFVRDQESKVFFGEMGLGERVKRSGGVGMVKDSE